MTSPGRLGRVLETCTELTGTEGLIQIILYFTHRVKIVRNCEQR